MQDGPAEALILASPTHPPLETYLNRLNPQPISINTAFDRFRWPAFAPISEIRVLRDSADEDSEQDLYQAKDRDGTFSLHHIASESYTNPPVSSITTSIDILYEYSCRVTWEELHIVDRYTVGDDVDVPCSCCNRMPYCEPKPLIIRATSKTYVTIEDIVSQVTEYVNSLREDILEALDAVGEHSGERTPDFSSWVFFSRNSINIEEARSLEELIKTWRYRAKVVRRSRLGLHYKPVNLS
ncbi:uncharacterized protein CTRU02_202936 [Colletotrichum truncatum]|uniref:Uncharacterized protein n=1 Tax=Colletotrichum truncatum TaxID=5467 RepID=A0ACC3Z7V3_COLTU|nr:uncharacterized protein CTRU02_13243 [Colletotrichum truncatum]KAF6783735.1 hypothetical protein CTRU02_13243 [Colletotrichum truncatum]